MWSTFWFSEATQHNPCPPAGPEMSLYISVNGKALCRPMRLTCLKFHWADSRKTRDMMMKTENCKWWPSGTCPSLRGHYVTALGKFHTDRLFNGTLGVMSETANWLWFFGLTSNMIVHSGNALFLSVSVWSPVLFNLFFYVYSSQGFRNNFENFKMLTEICRTSLNLPTWTERGRYFCCDVQ